MFHMPISQSHNNLRTRGVLLVGFRVQSGASLFFCAGAKNPRIVRFHECKLPLSGHMRIQQDSSVSSRNSTRPQERDSRPILWWRSGSTCPVWNSECPLCCHMMWPSHSASMGQLWVEEDCRTVRSSHRCQSACYRCSSEDSSARGLGSTLPLPAGSNPRPLWAAYSRLFQRRS